MTNAKGNDQQTQNKTTSYNFPLGNPADQVTSAWTQYLRQQDKQQEKS